MADAKQQERKSPVSMIGSALKDNPATARLAEEAKGYLQAKGKDLVGQVTDRLEQGDLLGPGLTEGVKRLARGDSPLKAVAGSAMAEVKDKVTNMFGRGKGKSGGSEVKVTSIIEDIDVGVPLRVAYDQWTQFADFPQFMKKVESAEQESDEKINWKAQVLWSHRTWEATIEEQIPDDHIIWKSKAAKGHVDGCVSFHELGPRLTRIMLVLEYHPQGLFEHTGNIWRAQGRRARLELKHFRRHVMTRTILDEEELEGWRGEIREGEVVVTHEDAMEAENEGYDESDQDEDTYDEDEADYDDEDEDEADEDSDYEDDADYDDEDEDEDRESA